MKSLPTLAAVLGGLADAAEIADSDGRVVYVNAACARALGYDAEELIGKLSSEVHTALPAHGAGTPGTGRVTARTKAGDQIVFEVSVSAIHDDAGELCFSVALLRDVTRRELEERALRRSEELYRQIFHSNQAIKLLIDPETGTIEDANQGAVDFYGYPIDELRGLNIARINTAAPPRIHEAMDLAKTTGARTFRFGHRVNSGELKDVEVFSGPVDLGDRKLLFSIIHDVSDRARAEAQLAGAARMESLGRLAGGVAHDFNNLLFVILNEVRLVTRRLPAEDPLRPDVERIREAATRAAELTRHLLLFARGGDVTPEPTDIAKTARGVASLVSSSLGREVRLHIDAQAKVIAYIATAQLEQVLVNLIMNAREAMPDGGDIFVDISKVSIPVGTFETSPRAEHFAEITVKDNGLGIAPEVLTHVFEPFFTTKGSKRGTGLGLAISYGIIQRAGGTISVESVVASGTTFRIRLPLSESVADAVANETALSSDERSVVLVVERDEAVRVQLQRCLAAAGYAVLLANGPLEAALLAEQQPAIDLLLAEMSSADGVTPAALAEALLRDRPAMRVLFVSDGARDGSTRSPLSKPFSDDEVLHWVRDTLT